MEDLQLRIGFALLHGGKATWRFIVAWFQWYWHHFIPMLFVTILMDITRYAHMYWLSDAVTGVWLAAACYGAAVTARSMRQDGRRQRYTAALTRIAEIEADALMPLDEWLERDMARREKRLVPKPTKAEIASGNHREHLEHQIQKHYEQVRRLKELEQRAEEIRQGIQGIMVGYVPEPTAEAKMLAEARRQRIAAAQQYIASEREEKVDSPKSRSLADLSENLERLRDKIEAVRGRPLPPPDPRLDATLES